MTSPRYAAFKSEWSTPGRKRAGFIAKVWDAYVAEHNAFMRAPSVNHAMAMLGCATQLHVVTLAEQEHSFVSKALQQPSTRVKALRGFYGSTFRSRLYRELLPHDTLPGAFCNGRVQALSTVTSWETWNDKAFYEGAVLTLMQLRARLNLEPQQPPVAPVINIPTQKRVERTVERDADGVILKLIDTPVEG
jgi:hypothetical protein